MSGIINQTRREQTDIELCQLKREIELWYEHREGQDKQHQYKTQLNAIKALLNGAIAHLQTELNSFDLKISPGEFFEDCRLFDLRVIWLRKLWRFYKDKFDQRDDEHLKPLLLAADEVVWSCYHQVFEKATLYAPEIKQGPAPLPFIESSYSPQSFPSESVPYDLKPSESGFLQSLMDKLPIPLVSLPQSCLMSPWWLVYIGHEVGHHIQFALSDKKKYVASFQKEVQEAVAAKDGDQDDIDKWGRWSKEIFADVFSVLLMGQWAVWAMVEFEMQKPAAMLARRAQYPSPAVRLFLLAHTANCLGLDGKGALRGLDIVQMVSGNQQAERDCQFVQNVVEKALETEPTAGVTLERLADFRREDFEQTGEVHMWSARLREPDPMAYAINSLRAPRLIASAAVAAWAEIMMADDTQRSSLRLDLAGKATKLIILSREPGDREAIEMATETTDLAAELARHLLDADQQQLDV